MFLYNKTRRKFKNTDNGHVEYKELNTAFRIPCVVFCKKKKKRENKWLECGYCHLHRSDYLSVNSATVTLTDEYKKNYSQFYPPGIALFECSSKLEPNCTFHGYYCKPKSIANFLLQLPCTNNPHYRTFPLAIITSV